MLTAIQSIALVALVGAVTVFPSADAARPMGQVILVGHDALVPMDEPIRRIITKVDAVDGRAADGHVYAIDTANKDFRPEEVRGWRLTVLTGALAREDYKIASNTASAVTVADVNGPLDKIAPGDMIMIEEVFERNLPVSR